MIDWGVEVLGGSVAIWCISRVVGGGTLLVNTSRSSQNKHISTKLSETHFRTNSGVDYDLYPGRLATISLHDTHDGGNS